MYLFVKPLFSRSRGNSFARRDQGIQKQHMTYSVKHKQNKQRLTLQIYQPFTV